jgi:RimJ/RimL family protein N-acetyltransferase
LGADKKENRSLHELKKSEFNKVHQIFKGIEHSLSIKAAMQGTNPGRIFVDNFDLPKTALALTVEGYLLAGDHSDPAVISLLRKLFKEQILTGRVFIGDDDVMELIIYPDTWEPKLHEIIPTHEADKLLRYRYECSEAKLDWRDLIPKGYTLSPIDRRILNSTSLTFPDDMWEEIETSWGTSDSFLKNGLGFCILYQKQLVSWCIADCKAGDRVDVGAATVPDQRRRGLATAVVTSMVEHCLRNGFSVVGWHCEQSNIGSWKTAEKVGFKRAGEYAAYYYIFDEVGHLAQLGWSCFQRGEYRQTIDYYERVFALRDSNPCYYYHVAAAAWAAQGNAKASLMYLNRAVESGWTDSGTTKRMKEFNILHDTDDWNTILRSIADAQNRESR